MTNGIDFDWDDANIAHVARHKVTPREAEQVIENEPVDLDIQFINDEDRYVVVGVTDAGRFLVIVWTDRNGAIRVVTAFDAEASEQQEYWRIKGH